MPTPSEFWANPQLSDISDFERRITKPEFFLGLRDVTKLIVATLKKHVRSYSSSILELGCNVGRNLYGLKRAGYFNLHGIEINPRAVELGRKHFNLDNIDIKIGSIEDLIEGIDPVDCIFTVGVLMHNPNDWILDVIKRKAKRVILTSENETSNVAEGVFRIARDYSKVFSDWKQVECIAGDGGPANPKVTITRVFVKQ
jgi:SAM-dependent methyltransferase